MAGMVQDEDGAIIAIRNYIETARADLRAENSRIVGQIDGWRPNWQGEGSNSFESFKLAWNDRFATLLATLDQFEQSLTTTSTGFESTDSDAGSQFTSLTGNVQG